VAQRPSTIVAFKNINVKCRRGARVYWSYVTTMGQRFRLAALSWDGKQIAFVSRDSANNAYLTI